MVSLLYWAIQAVFSYMLTLESSLLCMYSPEFEFSFPSELSPSLFGLPFANERGRGLLSPTGSSFPALSTTSHSPSAWADAFLVKSPQAVAGPSGTTSTNHQRQDSALVAKKLFEDDERSALDDFFNKTLDDAPKAQDVVEDKSPTQAESAAGPSSGGNTPADVDDSTLAAASESRKRSRKQPATKAVTTTMKNVKAKGAVSSRGGKKASPVAKIDGGEPGESEEGHSPAKGGRTDSLTTPALGNQVDSGVLAASAGPGKRSSHIASEQKRRSTIKDNYKALVDLLLAGEATSGISLLGGGEDDDDLEGGGTKKSKPKGRGRGRKGQDGAGATKSVVLERAADYLRWLDKGNDELDNEIGRLESILAK